MTAPKFQAINIITANSSVCHLLWLAEKEKLITKQNKKNTKPKTQKEARMKMGGSDNYSASSLPQLQ